MRRFGVRIDFIDNDFFSQVVVYVCYMENMMEEDFRRFRVDVVCCPICSHHIRRRRR